MAKKKEEKKASQKKVAVLNAKQIAHLKRMAELEK